MWLQTVVSNSVNFEPLHHKILASKALDFSIEYYSLGGATPQRSHSEVGSCASQRGKETAEKTSLTNTIRLPSGAAVGIINKTHFKT